MPLTQSRRPVGRVASVWTLEGTAAQARMKHTGSETSSEPIWVFTKPQMSDLQTLEILLMGASESPGSASVLQTNDKSWEIRKLIKKKENKSAALENNAVMTQAFKHGSSLSQLRGRNLPLRSDFTNSWMKRIHLIVSEILDQAPPRMKAVCTCFHRRTEFMPLHAPGVILLNGWIKGSEPRAAAGLNFT